VIEIDAASNTGVDNIRELIERAQFAPVQCRYKVYIIDEVHMLSTAAFNALLKTLEEPPARVVFVLATTDPQRVLPTIISRCQRFDFRRIPLEAMVKHLLHIASQENITITSDAITLVAQVAQGGLRDAESLLDQLSLLPGEVTVEAVWDLVGAVPEQDLLALTKAIADDKSEVVLDQCRRLMDRGREPLVVLQNLAGFYRDLLIAKTAPNRSNLVAVTPPTWKQLCEFAQQFDVSDILVGSQHLKNSEAQVKNTTQPRLWLEVTLLGLLPSANLSQPASTTSQPQRQKAEVKRQELQTHREPGRPQELTPPVSSHRASQATSDSPQKETPSPQEPTAPTSAPNGNSVSDPQHQQPAATTAKASPVSSSEPTSVQPAASTVSAAEPSSDSEQSIAQIWEKVLKHLHPYAAHALVSQHCHLLSFEGSVACVAVNSQPLLTLAQEKLPNLEAAFEAVYNYRVQVRLQTRLSKSSTTAPASRGSASVEASEKLARASSPSFSGNADTPNVPGSGNSRRDNSKTEAAERSEHRRVSTEPSDTAENEPKSQSRFIDKTPQATVTQPAPKSSLTFAQMQVSPEPQPQTQVEIDRSSLTTVVDQSPISLSVQEVDSDADEVEQALRELKQFFEGEYVELTDEFCDRDSTIALAQPHDRVGTVVPQELAGRSAATITSNNTDQPQWADTYPPELDPEEYWEEQDSIEKAATYQMESSEIAAFDNTQKPLRGANLQYDEDGDIAF
jgi:DNA polymerase-3 subunit gamma/tau